MKVRTVTLRIMREGPTHNHLLSPLTPYLAAVGPYEAVSLRMPYEHRRLLRDLSSLRYGATAKRGADVTRITGPDRRIIADNVSEIFAAIPGLTSEMVTEASCHPSLTHLCLVFSASELSLLPFELATAPRGFPGEGSPLSVQSVAPVVITRSIPGATGHRCDLVKPPRILFVAARPPGFPEIPFKPHLLALLSALRPWAGSLVDDLGPDDMPEKRLKDYLTVLPRASLADIEEACCSEQYTHVHILAHSQELEEGGQSQFALALHDRAGGKALVSADRLQAALRLPLTHGREGINFSHPLVVSLATCDSGQQAQVVFPAMSLAHALHAAGVPLVVGSLFPLSHRGSVVLVQTLYTGLLRGRDPRRVLHDVRHALFRMGDVTHDWASVVAYTSFPDDFDDQVGSLTYEACKAGIKSGMKIGDKLVGRFDSSVSGAGKRLLERLTEIECDIKSAARDMPTSEAFSLEGPGMLASKDKQLAEMFFYAAKKVGLGTAEAQDLLRRSNKALANARKQYEDAAKIPRWTVPRPKAQLPTTHWLLTQALSLRMVLDKTLDWKTWWAAEVDADSVLLTDVSLRKPGDDIWAHGTLMELYLLAHGALSEPDSNRLLKETLEGKDTEAAAREHLQTLVDLAAASGDPFYVESTRKQLARYMDWWFCGDFAGEDAKGKIATAVVKLVQDLLKIIDGHR